MKRLLQIIFVTIMCFSLLSCFTVKAENGSLIFENIKMSDKSSAVGVNKFEVVNTDVNNSMFFNKVGDYITYNVIIKNTSETNYVIRDIQDDNHNEYIKYEYPEFSDREVPAGAETIIRVKATYVKKTPNKVVSATSVNFNVLYDTPGGHHNAYTVDYIIIYISLFILSTTGFILTFTYSKKKANLYIMILLGIGILLPFNAGAESRVVTFKINNNITEKTVSFLKSGRDVNVGIMSALSGENLHWVNFNSINYSSYELFNDSFYYDYLDDNMMWNFSSSQMNDMYDKQFYGNLDCTSVSSASDEQYNSVKNTLNDSNIISLSNSEIPTYYWIENNIVYIYTSADRIMLNEDSSYLFAYFISAESIDVSKFNTSNVTDINHMFYLCDGLSSLDLSNFDTSKVTNMSGLFYFDYVDETGHIFSAHITSLDLSNFDTGNVVDMSDMFGTITNLTSLDISSFDTSKVRDMSYMFSGSYNLLSLDVTHFDTSNVTDMSGMFDSCESLTVLDITNFDTSKVTNMANMFAECWKLTSLDLSSFDTSKVTDMSGMFMGCSGLTSLDVSNFYTSNVTNMCSMFRFEHWDDVNGVYLTPHITTLDLSSFDTSKVVDMTNMFVGSSSLLSINLSSFDTSNVVDFSSMFRKCSSLEHLDISNFTIDKQNVSLAYMFSECTNLVTIDMSGLDSSNINDTISTFINCSALRTIYVKEGFNLTSLFRYYDMFVGCTSLVGGAGTEFNPNNHNYYLYAKVDEGPSSPGYFTLKE